MTKPDNCSICNSTDIVLVTDNSIFNPDTDEYEIMHSYNCNNCGCIHVENKDFKFIQLGISTNKAIQTTDCNITSK